MVTQGSFKFTPAPLPEPWTATIFGSVPSSAGLPSPESPSIEQLVWHVALPHPHHRRVYVRLDVPSSMGRELMLPVWTPGSYMIREYAQYVFDVHAKSSTGQNLSIKKISKNRWQVAQSQHPSGYSVWYTLSAHVLSVRTNCCEEDWAHWIGAATFLLPIEQVKRSGRLRVQAWLPSTWQAHVSLPHQALPQGLLWGEQQLHGVEALATDYDHLLDAPWLVGRTRKQTFVVHQIEHEVISCGQDDTVDLERLTTAVEQMVGENYACWQQMPYAHYQFFFIWAKGYGGLEHRDCSVMLVDPNDWQQENKRDEIYSLVAHEHFHAWNGKRLRPIALGPFDYERENYTPSLWLVEGITSYLDGVQATRAGCIGVASFLQSWSQICQAVGESTAHTRHSLTESSMDAWIKFYRMDGYSQAYVTNYYSKGSVVAWLLDGWLQHTTQDQLAIEDVLRLAYPRYSQQVGYTESQWRALLTECSGHALDEFFADYVDGVAELPIEQAAAWFGCLWQPLDPVGEQDGWCVQGLAGMQQVLGCALQRQPTHLQVDKIREGGFAYQLGLRPGDQLVAIDKHSLMGRSYEQSFGVWPLGSQHRLIWLRDGLVYERQGPWLTPQRKYQLVRDKQADATAKQRFHRWLSSKASGK